MIRWIIFFALVAGVYISLRVLNAPAWAAYGFTVCYAVILGFGRAILDKMEEVDNAAQARYHNCAKHLEANKLVCVNSRPRVVLEEIPTRPRRPSTATQTEL